ncbi:MAG: tetraacyldisaccharide 4'-kinase [Candidatus Nitrotoga sp.]
MLKTFSRWLEEHWYQLSPIQLFLGPFSFVFRMLTIGRRLFYRFGILRSEKLPVPVIIIGNITVGGTGKTPLTLWLAQKLIDNGWRPGIISRGYGGSANMPQKVDAQSDPAVVGDEPALMARRKICPVWIGRNRVAAGRALLQAHPECNVILSDDGLQHYQLRRDIEILVIDGVRTFGNGMLLPSGPLREPSSRMNSVDAIVLHGGVEDVGDAYSMKLRGETFYNLRNPEITAKVADFRDKDNHAVAGIASPQRFFDYLRELGLKARTHPYPDHHPFMPADINFRGAEAILMTEKDAVKCAPFATDICWVLRVDAHLPPTLIKFILGKLSPENLSGNNLSRNSFSAEKGSAEKTRPIQKG